MRFINIVLLQLFAVAGSTFALAPKLFLEVDGRVDCLQHNTDVQQPEPEDIQISYSTFAGDFITQDIPLAKCTPLTLIGHITAIKTPVSCILYRPPFGAKPCDPAGPSKNVPAGKSEPDFAATQILCLPL